MATLEFTQPAPQTAALTSPPPAETPMMLLLDADGADGGATAAGSSFLLDMAHELRSPLLALSVSLDVLNGDAGRLPLAEERRLLDALQRNAVHLQTLVENLLDAASIDARRFSVTRAAIDLAAVIHEAILVVDPLLGPHGQMIHAELPPQGLVVHADGQRLRQVLVNLLHNAIKYGPHDEMISARAWREGDVVTVEVSDRGAGIPPGEQPYLFNSFFRGRSGQSMERGHGLGLAIARTIVQAHGGDIGVRSGNGRGTTFWLTLPGA